MTKKTDDSFNEAVAVLVQAAISKIPEPVVPVLKNVARQRK